MHDERTYTPTQLAELHLIAGRLAQVLKNNEVLPGTHALKNRVVTFTLPESAAVVRDPGRGDGRTDEPVEVKLTMGAVLLFVDRAQHNPPTCREELVELWRVCVVDDARGVAVEAPAEAVEAIGQVREERKEETCEVRTPAKRVGEKGVRIAFSRVKAARSGKRKRRVFAIAG